MESIETRRSSHTVPGTRTSFERLSMALSLSSNAIARALDARAHKVHCQTTWRKMRGGPMQNADETTRTCATGSGDCACRTILDSRAPRLPRPPMTASLPPPCTCSSTATRRGSCGLWYLKTLSGPATRAPSDMQSVSERQVAQRARLEERYAAGRTGLRRNAKQSLSCTRAQCSPCAWLPAC